MDFSLDQRTASLSVGEFADFSTGPREAGGGAGGLWRAQLGTHWHNELRAQTAADTPDAEFEVVITGQIFHGGWTIALAGRIDQLLRPPAAPPSEKCHPLGDTSPASTAPPPEKCHLIDDTSPAPTTGKSAPATGGAARPGVLLREIKTVTRPLPADEGELRAAYPGYFIQLATYAALHRQLCRAGSPDPAVPHSPAGSPKPAAKSPPVVGRGLPTPPTQPSQSPAGSGDPALQPQLRSELVFVEAGSGLAQTIALTPADDVLFRVQLERVAEFLNLRLRARERLRHLAYRPPFATLRPGQETTETALTALFERHPLVLFEAPTGFGKTGVLLEFALGQLRSGHFDRALYLTSKSTGQLQVVRTLAAMTAPEKCHLMGDTFPKPVLPLAAPPGPPPGKCHLLNDTASGSATFAARRSPTATPVAAWHVRNKSEHCVNHTFHCVRESCAYLDGAVGRWPQSGLARFYLDEKHARDLDTLRAAGRAARICPYEITRAALAFNDVWIGDYNYVFAPRNRGLFFEQHGFAAARTLILLDEAHNLPSRVADAYSHVLSAADAFTVRDELHRIRPLASLVTAWDHWCHFLHHLRACAALPLAAEDDARHLLSNLADLIATVPLDLAALGPRAADLLWQVPSLVDELASAVLPRLWWCPCDGELNLTCLDAAPAIGATLREFGGVVLASATLTPVEGFAAACGLTEVGAAVPSRPEFPPDQVRLGEPPPPSFAAPERLGTLNKRTTKKLYRQLTSAAELLRVEEARAAASPALLRAATPWREGAYDIAFDARIDTTFQHRSHHYTATAATVAALQATANRTDVGRGLPTPPSLPTSATDVETKTGGVGRPRPTSAIAVFFPSYAYAEAIRGELVANAPALRVALQPKLRDLAAQSAWVADSLLAADALFLVLGSSFAESIDALGGRVTHAMVVGPALPEVNAVQRARLAEAARAGLTREEAFRHVYQIPGMTKVNQALGRLVRAPGQRARVILHCRRFLEPSYASLLAPDYQTGASLLVDSDLAAWLTPASS
jgi:Rad3-related DNA helicase